MLLLPVVCDSLEVPTAGVRALIRHVFHISIISVDGRLTIAGGFDQRGDVRRQRIEAGYVVDVALCWSTGD